MMAMGVRLRFATLALLASTLLCLGVGVAQAQQASPHELVWAHAKPSEITGFVVFLSSVEGSVDDARRVQVGLPETLQSSGMQFYSAIVSASVDEFVAVAAIDRQGQMSELSAWSGMPPSTPGKPFLIVP